MAERNAIVRTMKRRGILAAAGTVVAGFVAKQASVQVRATTTDTSFVATGGSGASVGFDTYTTGLTIGVRGFGSSNGIFGVSGSTGVYGSSTGTSTSNIGVQGFGPIGVSGTSTSSNGTGIGVKGTNTGFGYGVEGTSVGGDGVFGSSEQFNGVVGSTSAPDGYVAAGVFGVTLVTSGTGSSNVGVWGSAGGAGIGVRGDSTSGTGVIGITSTSYNYGVLGTTYATNSTAIAGTCSGNGSSAFSGGTTNPNAYAGVFQGNVVIQGRLVVSDPSYKSGALAHPDGSTRLVYCVESPESWIEDVGKGQLTSGKASITFDKDFAAVTHTDDYRVFLTPEGDSRGLYVTNKTASGFEVHEQQGGTSTLGFSWKVMVKAKSSVKSERLGKFTMPKIALPDVSKFKVPEMPKPALPRQP